MQCQKIAKNGQPVIVNPRASKERTIEKTENSPDAVQPPNGSYPDPSLSNYHGSERFNGNGDESWRLNPEADRSTFENDLTSERNNGWV
ncbi:MAG: hypothetical protein U5N86_05145 [Planctomycetota bacterium]|nr:hypothetical protein [Planctomycetota bacterium]